MLTLFETCLNFISVNIVHVDTLESFPELIGQKLFECCTGTGELNSLNSSSITTISKFAQAYTGLICSKLHISRVRPQSVPFLSELVHHLSLTELNLNNCALGDDHPVLEAVSRLSKYLNHTSDILNCILCQIS